MTDAMEDAFDALKRYEACDGHVWRKPRRTMRADGYGEHRVETSVFGTSCVKCGLRVSRPTLARLKREIIGS